MKAWVIIGILLLVGVASAFDYTEGQWNGGINTSTVLMIHPDGESGITSISDSSFYSHPITVGGAVTISNITYQYPNYSTFGTTGISYNGSSIYFDGIFTSNITSADSPDWAFGTGDFTIDFWENPSSLSSSPFIVDQGTTTSSRWYFQHTSSGLYVFSASLSGVTLATYSTTNAYTTLNTWRHVVFERKGTTARFYINGVEVPITETTAFGSSSMPDLGSPLRIGSYTSSAAYSGYLQEIRVSKGIARYPMQSGPELRTAPYTNWSDTTISGAYFQTVPKTVTYNQPFNYTVYARNVSNVSYVNVNITFPTNSLRADNVFFNDTQFNSLVAIVNNASATGFVNVNITNQTWLGNLSSGNPGTFDVQFRYINSTSFGPANVTISPTSFWNGNYSVVNSGNFYFRDNANGDVAPAAIPPICNFTANTTYGVKPLAVLFNDTSTNGPVTSWLWQFGDGSTSSLQNVTYTYATAGVYTANLTVSNAVGSNKKDITITVLNTAPPNLLADFSASNTAPALSESIAFTDASTGTPTTWNWSFGDGTNSTLQNPSHAYSSTGLKTVFLNVSNATGAFSQTTKVNYINVTTNGTASINTQDIVMAAAYNLVITVTSTADGLPIPGVTITDQSNQTVLTDGVGIGTLTEPYSTVTGTLVATGYVSRSFSIVVDNDTWVTYQMQKSSSETTTNLNVLYPHETTFTIIDLYGNRLTRINVSAQMTSTTVQGNWWQTLFGISSAASPEINNTVMYGETDDYGKIAFPMISSATYTMVFTNSTFSGGSTTKRVTPDQSAITIVLQTIASTRPVNKEDYINGTLYTNTALDPTIYLNLSYNDTSLGTTSVTFFVNFPNQTVKYTKSFPGTSTTNQSFSTGYGVQNVKGDAYVWGYYSNTSFGNSSKSQGITFNGPSGSMIDLFTYHSGWD